MAVLRESAQGAGRRSSGENYEPLRIVLDGDGVRVERIGPNGMRVGWKERARRTFLAGRASAGRVFVTGRRRASRIGSHATTTLRTSTRALIRGELSTRLRCLGG